MGETVGELLRAAASRLADLPQALPRLEAELLLMEATRLTREQLTAWPERELGPEELARFRYLLKRRLSGEPIAYIRGRQAFWTLDLEVTPDTLIPRPETELLVETALALLAADKPLVIADAGTGSGAIAAALAVERPSWTLIAIEHSAAATAVAASNLGRCARANTRIIRGDWLAPIADSCLDAVIGNPPYIREGDPHLTRGDLPWEPALALTPGPDGMDALRRITRRSVACLKPGGLLALEHGFDQAERVRSLIADHGFRGVRTHRDLAGHPRVTSGWRRA
jgi:release factor glutamine methyltransferase